MPIVYRQQAGASKPKPRKPDRETQGTQANQGKPIRVKVSHYWPPLGGPNCSNYYNGTCYSHLASGKRWQDWVDKAVACPKEYPFGTEFILLGKTYTCMDRGGKIVSYGRVIWLDILTKKAPVPYGTVVDARVLK